MSARTFWHDERGVDADGSQTADACNSQRRQDVRRAVRRNQSPEHTEYLQQDVRTWTLPCAALVVPVSTWTDPKGL